MAKSRAKKTTTKPALGLMDRIKQIDITDSRRSLLFRLSDAQGVEFKAAIKALKNMPAHKRPAYSLICREMSIYFGVKVSEHSLRRYIDE